MHSCYFACFPMALCVRNWSKIWFHMNMGLQTAPLVSLNSNAAGTLAVCASLDTPADLVPSESPLFSQAQTYFRNGVLISIKMRRIEMTLCQTDVKLFLRPLVTNNRWANWTRECILKITKKAFPCIGNYHCGLVTLASARNPAHRAKNASQWARNYCD